MSHQPTDPQQPAHAEEPAAPSGHLPPQQPTTRDLNVAVIATVAIIAVLTLFVLVTGTQAWYRMETMQEHKRKVVDQPFTQRNAMINRQLIRIHQDKWANSDKQVAQVPIDRAMQLVAQRYSKSKSGSGAASGRGAKTSASPGTKSGKKPGKQAGKQTERAGGGSGSAKP